jgi:hypothetical protein
MGRICGESVEFCFLLSQSALTNVVLTKFEEHERVTLDIDEDYLD